MTSAIDLFQEERQRQIDLEGWSVEHDDKHNVGEMLDAAIVYLWHGTDNAAQLNADGTPAGWPWEAQWWKPKDRPRNIVRAGALLLAEQQRLKRAGEPAFDVEQLLAVAVRELDALLAA